jgi:hypothetical protein
MRGRSAPIRRTAAAIGLALALAAALPAAASADPTARGYRPNANHLSVVVTFDLVYITWTTPTGVQPAKVSAMRGAAAACPATPGDGTLVRGTTVANHAIDPNVKAGASYCYTVFVTDSAGTVTKIGSTGPVAVPDRDAPPPAAVANPTPIDQAPASSSTGNGTASKGIAASLGGLLALALVVVILRMLRRSRTASARPVFGSELRLTFTGLSASALIIPAVIALAWVLVVTAVVVFR